MFLAPTLIAAAVMSLVPEDVKAVLYYRSAMLEKNVSVRCKYIMNGLSCLYTLKSANE
jgi:hypothetical protein